MVLTVDSAFAGDVVGCELPQRCRHTEGIRLGTSRTTTYADLSQICILQHDRWQMVVWPQLWELV